MLDGLGEVDARADTFTGVQVDSRRIGPGDLFVAVGRGVGVRGRRARARRSRHARAATTRSRRLPARASRARPQLRARRRDHRLDGQDVDEGHPRRVVRPVRTDDRGRGELQQRDRSAADALPARARHGGLHARAGDARVRPDCRARGDRASADRCHHERRPGPPGARGLARRRRTGEGRADRSAAAGRHGDRARATSRSPATTSRSIRVGTPEGIRSTGERLSAE